MTRMVVNRLFAVIWLLVVIAAGGYVTWRVVDGLHFRTDLMALLPRDDQNPAVQKANDLVTQALSQKVLLLVGHVDRQTARRGAEILSQRLQESGLLDITTSGFDQDRMRQMGALYFPYRQGLLSDGDRQRLLDGQGGQVAVRALSQIFGFVGAANAQLLRNDPFLLMQSFFTSLPLPLSKLTLDQGMLSVRDDRTTWIMVAGQLRGEPYDLTVQRRLTDSLVLNDHLDGVQILRLGAVFFAQAGAEQAMTETSHIGVWSILGTVILVVLAFRALRPLWFSLLVITVGIGVALAASLWVFQDLHVGALLFGVSLIGVAVDYSLQYCAEMFAEPASSRQQLDRVFAAITVGTATTVIGYLTLLLAPFPGLHQIAVFSVVGLLSAWLTVVLWLPRLGNLPQPTHGRIMMRWAGRFVAAWEKIRRRRLVVLGVLIVGGASLGLLTVRSDDDIRRMQSLSPHLVAQQMRIQDLIGSTGGSQFFLVQGGDDETALQRQEALIQRLRVLVSGRSLGGFQAPAQYVPSALRQMDNRRLVAEQLEPLRAGQFDQLGLAAAAAAAVADQPLTLSMAMQPGGPLGFLSMLVLAPGTHVVSLDQVHDPIHVAAAADGLEGVRFIDPAGQFSALLGKYRERALGLLVLSAVLMLPLLIWRYGAKGAVPIMLPPLFAVLLTPVIRALFGGAFTFFDAMALVLVLSIGVDYAVFCAETSDRRKAVTMLAVTLAALTSLLSFGLLALSQVTAVHAFGSTMLLGILIAAFFAPIARYGR